MRYKIDHKYVLMLIVVTIGIVAYFYMGELTSITKALSHIKTIHMISAVGCMAFYWMIEARTLQLMLRTYEPDINYAEVAKLVMATQFFNGITPFSTGGQPFQIYVLSKKRDMHISSVTCASVHNFIVYQVVLVVMGTFALIISRFMDIVPGGANDGWLVFLGFALNIGVIVGLLLIAFLPGVTANFLKPIYHIINRFKGKERCKDIRSHWDEKVALFHTQIWEVIADQKLFVRAMCLNIVKLLSLYSVTYFLCLTIGINTMTLFQGIVISAYVMLITSMVPVPGASGGAEFGFALFFGAVIGAQVAVIMLLWRFVTYYIGLIIGSAVYYFGYVME